MRTRGATDIAVTGGRLRILAAAGLVAAVSFSGGIAAIPAHAQEPAAEFNEVPIGTFTIGNPHDGFSIVEPPAGVPERKRDSSDDGSGRWFFQGWQKAPAVDTSEDLYNDALRALDSGHTADAQRLFERLIAKAPDSRRAGEAREHLGRIYRNVETGTADRRPSQLGSTELGPTELSPTELGVSHPDGAREAALPWSEASPEAAAAKPAALDVSPALSRAALQSARVSSTVDGQFLSDAGDRVFFSAGSANLGTRARGVLQSQARFLALHPELFAAVEGHADDGSLPDDETLRLSQQRAAAVRERLIAEGVEAGRLTAYGRGREDRVSNCPAPECLAQNRRVVTILLSGQVSVDAKPVLRAQKGKSGPSGSPSTQ